MLEIYTDGAYNPGLDQGGWAAVLIDNGQKRVFSGVVNKTTNNRMEVMAALEGVSRTPLAAEVTVYTDSQYLFGTVTKGWRKHVNRDLWERLDEAISQRKIRWKWIRGNDQAALHIEAHQQASEKASLQADAFVKDREVPQSALIPHEKKRLPVQMMDVGDKPVTQREAIARGVVRMKPSTLEQIVKGNLPKGDVLQAAQIAGIMAAKQTPHLIPLCHPLAIEVIEVQVLPDQGNSWVAISARVRGEGKTGMEMESLTAVAVAALTVYDMCKGIDPAMTIEVSLVKKSGGRSGTVVIRD